ncbi:hypothetical protein FOZ63_003480 [Perkinsus olseni]|uniref:Uncharacterized protein n=1 Tax=Perkinsus olseni TaxID=32597 RepID=A0A7J6S8P4_PEROL|nr:hypothetical protein FOZ63_003480 [Perkinsus olseni]
MFSSRVLVAALVGVQSTLSLHTAGQPMEVSSDGELAELSNKMDRLLSAVGAVKEEVDILNVEAFVTLTVLPLQLRGVVTANRGSCKLESDVKGDFHESKSFTIFLGNTPGSDVIRQTLYNYHIGREMLIGRAGYTASGDVFEVNWGALGKTKPLKISDNPSAARQHFSPIMPFAHLGDEVLSEIYGLIVDSEDDVKKCQKIFVLLANNPPHDYEKGGLWFEKFHLQAKEKAPSLISSWRTPALKICSTVTASPVPFCGTRWYRTLIKGAMVSSRVAVAAVVAAARSVLSLHTAGQSRDDTIANLKEKLGDISDVIDGMNENIRVLKLPGDVAAGRNKCTLKSALKGEYGDHESLTLFLEDVNGPELIRQTSYTHQHMGKLFTGKIGYTAGLKKFEIAWYVWSRETLTTENLPAARQHFSEIMPFAHLGSDKGCIRGAAITHPH